MHLLTDIKWLPINILNAIMILAILSLYIVLGFESIIVFVFFGIIHSFANRFIIFKNKHNICFNWYYFYSLVSLMFCCLYMHFYGNYFGWASDDLFFLNKVNEIITYGINNTEQYSFFELFNAFVFGKIFIVSNVNLLFVLPIVNMFASLLLSLIIVFNHEIFNNNKQIKELSLNSWPLLVIALSPVYIDIACHFYRDSFTVFLQLLSMILAIKHKYIYSLAFAIITGFCRGGNGILALLFLLLVLLSTIFENNTVTKSRLSRALYLIGVILIAITIYNLDSVIKFGTYTRSFSGENTVEMTMSERFANRQEYINMENAVYGKYSAVLVGLFSPLIVNDLIVNRPVNQGRQMSNIIMYNEYFIFETILIILWVLAIPRMLNGLVYCFDSNDLKLFCILILFITNVILQTYVSGQSRHRLSFMIFYAFFISCPIIIGKRSINILSYLVAAVLIVINTYYML